MQHLLKILIFIPLFIFSAYSQINISWENSYSVNDCRAGVESMSLDSTGNIITAGFFYGNSTGSGVVITKYSKDGKLIWSKEENITSSGVYVKLAIDSDGNIFIGTSNYSDWIMYKFDLNGYKVWEKRFKYWIYGLNNLKAIAMGSDGSIYATGYMQDSSWIHWGYYDYNLCLIKYTPDGNIEWVRYFDDGDNAEIGNDIYIGNNGDIAVCGRTFSNGDPSSNFLTLLYDSQGILKWSKKFGTVNSSWDVAYNVKMDGNNNVIVSGVLDTHLCVIKYDNRGIYKWSRQYNGHTEGYAAEDINMNIDDVNDIVLTAALWKPYGIFMHSSVLTVKYSPNGYKLWENTLSSPDWSAYPKSMMLDKFANIYVCSYSSEDKYSSRRKVLTHKYNRYGCLLWYKLYEQDFYGLNTRASLLDRNDNIYIGGSKRHLDSSDVTDDIFILKYTQANSSGIIRQFSLSQNYPNPFNPVTRIKFTVPESGNVKIKIFDVLGNLVDNLVDNYYNSGEHEVEFNGSMLASGVYFYVAEFGAYSETKKMVLLK